MEPEKWTHTIHRKGIILWSWNYHIMEPYQGHGIIPWDHTMAMESYHGIIPRPQTHTMKSYQNRIIPYHTQTFYYNIHISKQAYSK
jgi:hypothetical protein